MKEYKKTKKRTSFTSVLRIIILAVVMMLCGTSHIMADSFEYTGTWKTTPSDADLAAATKFNADMRKELIFTYGDYSENNFYQLYFSDMWHVIREICGESVYQHIWDNQTKVNASSIKWGFCDNCSQNYYSTSQWIQYYNLNAPGANAETAIKNKQDATCMYQWYIETSLGDKYLLTVLYRIKYTQENNILDNELAADNKTVTVGSTYSPQAHSTKGSKGNITYYGPFDTYAKAQSATSNSGTVGGRYATSASVSGDAGKTYYFKAVQDKWTDSQKDIPYNTASTVTSVSVVAKTVPKFNGSDATTTFGTYVSLQAYAEDYVYVSSYGGYAWMPITNNESTTTEYGKAYKDKECTQEISYNKQSWNSYAFSEAGTFYVKTTITPTNTEKYTSVTGVVKVTVNPAASPLNYCDNLKNNYTKSGDKPIIYRTYSEGLNISGMFADNASSGAKSYVIVNNATGLPYYISSSAIASYDTNLPVGTYSIYCNQTADSKYAAGEKQVIMKVLGEQTLTDYYLPAISSAKQQITKYTIKTICNRQGVPTSSTERVSFTGLGVVLSPGTTSTTNDSPSQSQRTYTVETSDFEIVAPSSYHLDHYSDGTRSNSNSSLTTVPTYYIKYDASQTKEYFYQIKMVGAGEFTTIIQHGKILPRTTIYRSLPDGLNITKLFTANSSGTATYSLYDSSNTPIALTNGTTLPDALEKGTYTAKCTMGGTTTQVNIKIVGVYERNVSYTAASGTGSFSFDTHDMTEALGVDNPIYIWAADRTAMQQDGASISGETFTNSGLYKQYDRSNLTLKIPNTHCWEFYTDYPTYTVGIDARSEAEKSSCPEMKTDYIVEYNREGAHSYTASGCCYSIVNLGRDEGSTGDTTPLDYLRFTVNIDFASFWPVPAGFNQQGGTDIEDDIASCPLTLGGNGTYGATAKTCNDADYNAGEKVFSYTTAGSAAASDITDLIPTSGTYYKFDPQYGDMLLTVGIYLPKRNKIMIIDSDGDTHTSRTDLGSGLEGWRDINGTVTLEVKAGHSYYFYSPDYPLQIFGYEYSKAE